MLFITESSLYPPSHVFRKVEPPYIHLYTLIQLFCLFAIWAVKKTPVISAYFPLVIMAMVPLKIYVLPSIFDDETEVEVDYQGEIRRMNAKEIAVVGSIRIKEVCDRVIADQAAGKISDQDVIHATKLSHHDDAQPRQVIEYLSVLGEVERGDGRFIRRANKARIGIRGLIENPLLDQTEIEDLSHLEMALANIMRHPPTMRLQFLDPHGDHGGDQEHHEKKG